MSEFYTPPEVIVEASVEMRRKKLEEIGVGVDSIADKLGHPIDAGIRDALIGLKANGVETSGSCEGHDDHGAALPWQILKLKHQKVGGMTSKNRLNGKLGTMNWPLRRVHW